MKTLSIVIYSKNKLASTVSLVKTLFKNEKLNVEVIVMDVSTDNTVDFLYKQFYDKILDGSLKLFSYKQAKPSRIRLDSLKEITGDHVWFIYAPDKIKLKFLSTIVDVLGAIKPDIMEFNIEHTKTGVSTYKPRRVDVTKKVLNIQKTPEILATSSPFLYSKIFKTSFLHKNIEILSFDSYFDSLYNYILLSMAKTYYFIDNVGLVVKPQIIHPNTFTLLSTQWNLIIDYFKEYTNWNITKKYVEYTFVSYIHRTLFPIINEMNIDSVDKYNKHRLLISKITKTFPNYRVNKFVLEDHELLKSTLLKSTKTPLNKNEKTGKSIKTEYILGEENE